MKGLNLREILENEYDLLTTLQDKDEIGTFKDFVNDFISEEYSIESLNFIEFQTEVTDLEKGYIQYLLIIEKEGVLYGGEVSFYSKEGYELDDDIFKEVEAKEITKTIYQYKNDSN